MLKSCIVYEQPLNELIRASLRLEHLFRQVDYYFSCASRVSTENHIQTLIKLLIDILNLLDRPDLKAKLTKEFNRLMTVFSRSSYKTSMTADELKKTIKQLKHLTTHFLDTPGKVGQTLRLNEFLSNLRHNLMSPGGDSCIDTPYYFYWLNQPHDINLKQLKKWFAAFDEIREATELLLMIVRNHAEPKKVIAEKGFYHEPLDSQKPGQLIRVGIAEDEKLLPEISAGRHRMTIRFVIPDIEKHPHQSSEDVSFSLALCIV